MKSQENKKTKKIEENQAKTNTILKFKTPLKNQEKQRSTSPRKIKKNQETLRIFSPT